MTDFPIDLSYACIDVKPIDYEFTGERWAEGTEDGSGWRVCSGTIVPNDQDLEITDGDRTLELDLDTFEIEVTWPFVNDDGDEDEDCKTVDPSDYEEYDDLAEKFGLDADEIRRHIDHEDEDDWTPMMNYAYPLDGGPPDDWKTRMTTCTCVEIDGNHYLALTGGGMDLSWEICESYMRLGYFPPAHFARLPSMAGRGTSERDKWIIEGCRKSLQGIRDRAERSLHALDEMVEWAKEDEAEHTARQAKG